MADSPVRHRTTLRGQITKPDKELKQLTVQKTSGSKKEIAEALPETVRDGYRNQETWEQLKDDEVLG